MPQSSPGTVDAYVIDGQFLLHTLRPSIPGNYGGLAACILMSERARKGLEEKEYIITGPEQHLPKRNADLHSFKFYVSNRKVIMEEVTELVSNHEEADTLICMHLDHINSTKVQNIIIRASYTDIAVILIYHRRKFDANIWMDIGTSFRNDRRYVNRSVHLHS